MFKNLDEDELTARLDFHGASLTLGSAGPEDTIFAHEGLAVLAIDEELSQALANDTLDVETTENGTALQLR